MEVVRAKTCRTEGEESWSASFGLRFRIPCMPSPVDKSYLRESCFALVFRSQSQNSFSESLFLLLLFSPSAVLTNAAFLCSHTDTAHPAARRLLANEKFGVIFNLHGHVLQSASGQPPAKACHETHGCTRHQKSQPTRTSRSSR